MTKGFHDHLKRPYYRKNRLHPMQFREATAEVFYKPMLLESNAFYTIAETPEKMQIITQLTTNIAFGDWDNHDRHPRQSMGCKCLPLYFSSSGIISGGGAACRRSTSLQLHSQAFVPRF